MFLPNCFAYFSSTNHPSFKTGSDDKNVDYDDLGDIVNCEKLTDCDEDDQRSRKDPFVLNEASQAEDGDTMETFDLFIGILLPKSYNQFYG